MALKSAWLDLPIDRTAERMRKTHLLASQVLPHFPVSDSPEQCSVSSGSNVSDLGWALSYH